MSDDKVFDVNKPSQVKPDSTSRPVIVGHRPIVQDPMTLPRDNNPTPDLDSNKLADTDEPKLEDKTVHTGGVNLRPTRALTAEEAKPAPEVHHPEVSHEEPKTENAPTADEFHSEQPGSEQLPPKPGLNQKDQAAVDAHSEAAQKLIDSKQYNVTVGHFHHGKNRTGLIIVGVVAVAIAIIAFLLVANKL